ncbi:hypothetical protein BC835DRAFT_1306426 [Cytidiella melzeri]|nr:hypothetical protein BC835DRAFT_1306426 [Cytidiella melzeri]
MHAGNGYSGQMMASQPEWVFSHPTLNTGFRSAKAEEPEHKRQCTRFLPKTWTHASTTPATSPSRDAHWARECDHALRVEMWLGPFVIAFLSAPWGIIIKYQRMFLDCHVNCQRKDKNSMADGHCVATMMSQDMAERGIPRRRTMRAFGTPGCPIKIRCANVVLSGFLHTALPPANRHESFHFSSLYLMRVELLTKQIHQAYLTKIR